MQFGLYNDLENIPKQRSSSAFQSITLGRSRLNQDVRPSNQVNTSAATRSFGLQSRILSSSGSLKFGQDVHETKRNISTTVSSTFGLISEELDSGAQNNEMLDLEFKRNEGGINRSLLSRPLGLQTKNLTSFSHVTGDNMGGNGSELINYKRNNMNFSSMSKTLDLRSETLGSLNSHDTDGLNNDVRRNDFASSSVLFRSGGFRSSRNVTVNPCVPSDGDLRLHEYSVHRNMSASRGFRPIPSNSSLATGLQMQESESYNVFDGFKRPLMSRAIRGRNSTLSSRIFHRENTDRHCKDLSNIHSFNVSRIPQRNTDALSRSRFGLNITSNQVDTQGISQTVLTGASVRAQLVNLLENLQYSILGLVPNIPAEALRLEFEKAKQTLDNINEMSFAPSIWNGDAASVISQSSNNIAPTVTQKITSSTLEGDLLNLKSYKEVLQSLMTNKEDLNDMKVKNNSSVHKGGKSIVLRSSRRKESDEEENSSFVFKRPRSFSQKKSRNQKVTDVEAPSHKSRTPKATREVINLKHWYPIAVGSDLAFCGIDEKGTTVKTEAVMKRLHNRGVQLISGRTCHLTGSPSELVSNFPKRIISLLKNGLTCRWRVLQKELISSQTAENETKKRKSKSPRKVISSPKKKTATPSKPKADKGKAQNLDITRTQSKEDASIRTRSGRVIKSPGEFWLVAEMGSNEGSFSSSQVIEESSQKKSKSPAKKSNKDTRKTPRRKANKSNKDTRKTPRRKANKSRDAFRGKPNTSRDASLGKANTSRDASLRRENMSRDASLGRKEEVKETPKEKTKPESSEARGKKKKENEEQVKVDSLVIHESCQNKSLRLSGKRKREGAGDAEAVQPKKKKSVNAPRKHSPKFKGSKPSPSKNIKTTVKKKKEAASTTERKKDTKEKTEVSEFEDDFEVNLDDIEIPEIVHKNGSPKLSRSEMRLISMETPPLKYFNKCLKIMDSVTPERSPNWCISRRTESEAKQFQRRREEVFKKKKVEIKKTIITEKSSEGVQHKDVERLLEWVAEKNVRSPQWNSDVLRYILPSRKRMEQQADEEDEEDEEDVQTEFL